MAKSKLLVPHEQVLPTTFVQRAHRNVLDHDLAASRSQIVILKHAWRQTLSLPLCIFPARPEPVAICDRSPEDFAFHPTAEATKYIRSQFVTLKRAGDDHCNYFPY